MGLIPRNPRRLSAAGFVFFHRAFPFSSINYRDEHPSGPPEPFVPNRIGLSRRQKFPMKKKSSPPIPSGIPPTPIHGKRIHLIGEDDHWTPARIELLGGIVCPEMDASVEIVVLASDEACKRARSLTRACQKTSPACEVLYGFQFRDRVRPSPEILGKILSLGQPGLKYLQEIDVIPNSREGSERGPIRGECFRNKQLANLILFQEDFADCNFQCADLTNVWLGSLSNCDLRGANLSDAIFWSFEGNAEKVDFSVVRPYSRLTLTNSNLRGCRFSNSLHESNFKGSDLRGVDFSNADLRGGTFQLTDVRDCNFRGANLAHASFMGAQVDGADFSNANIGDTNLETSTDVSKAVGLDKAIRGTPGVIGPATVAYMDVAMKCKSLITSIMIDMPDGVVQIEVRVMPGHWSGMATDVFDSRSRAIMFPLGYKPVGTLEERWKRAVNRWGQGTFHFETISVTPSGCPVPTKDVLLLARKAWVELVGSSKMTFPKKILPKPVESRSVSRDWEERLRRGEIREWNAMNSAGYHPIITWDKLNLAGCDLREFYFRFRIATSGNFSRANLEKANMEEALLKNANFSDANLRQAELNVAKIHQGNFRHADLTDASCGGTSFMNADFTHATLANACLNHANLCGANLSQANLRGTRLKNAKYDKYTLFPPGFVVPKEMRKAK